MNRREFLKTNAALGAAALFPFTIPQQAEAAIVTPPKDIFRTGLKTLNDLMGGGIRPGELCIVAGTACAGKTALCRAIMLGNEMKTRTETPSSLPIGSNDLLMLNPNGHCLFFTDYETGLASAEHGWERMHNTVRVLKEYAMYTNEAVIWTVPIIRPPCCPTEAVHHNGSFIRSADYYIVLNRDRRRLYLAKNRHGSRGAVPISFGEYYDAPVMIESWHRERE